MRRLEGSAAWLAGALLLSSVEVWAQAGATLEGVCVDAVTGEPVPWAHVQIGRLSRSQIANKEGRFAIEDLPAGSWEIVVHHVRYGITTHEVVILSGTKTSLVIPLTEVPIEMEVVEVVGERENLHQRDQTPVSLSGSDLREQLGGTIAETLADEPGLAERTMGPAPARPVARGLGGTRLLVLEDGGNPGDLSATAPDHAVVVDPLGAEGIEVVRGPAAFQHGSAVLGGVVNVRRRAIPRELPGRTTGGVSLRGVSVNTGASARLRLQGPLGSFAYFLEGVGRTAGDVRTPIGRLRNTAIDTWSVTGGTSRVFSGGFAGVSASRYESRYGIPGGFVGGHRNGVDIDLERSRYEGHAQLATGDRGLVGIEGRASYSRYFHREIESGGLCGVSFGLLTYDAEVGADFAWERVRGRLGLVGEYRDFAAGCFSFITPTTESTLGGFVYQEADVGELRVQAALRLDHCVVSPAEADTNKAGILRERTFRGMSGAVSVERPLHSRMRARAQVSRSFRPPAIEELFAEGPHLAAYSYEIGNVHLEAERGLGLEASLLWDGEILHGGATFFRNDLDGFIVPLDSGQLEYGQGELGFLPRFIYHGRDVVMTGGEIEGGWRATAHFSLDGSASWVRGEFRDAEEDLPRIPPLSGRLRGRYRLDFWTFGLVARGASHQDKLGVFETSTAAYAALDAAIEWRLARGARWFQSITLRGENLTDAAYRNHLSRVKSIMPEAGRSFSLAFEASF